MLGFTRLQTTYRFSMLACVGGSGSETARSRGGNQSGPALCSAESLRSSAILRSMDFLRSMERFLSMDSLRSTDCLRSTPAPPPLLAAGRASLPEMQGEDLLVVRALVVRVVRIQQLPRTRGGDQRQTCHSRVLLFICLFILMFSCFLSGYFILKTDFTCCCFEPIVQHFRSRYINDYYYY